MIERMNVETVSKKLFTVDEFIRLRDTGFFPEDSRFELIRGEIYEIPCAKGPHVGSVNRLTMLFAVRLRNSVVVSVQNGLFVDEMSLPHPDLLILKARADFYGDPLPVPEDVLLAVENTRRQ